ncbi:MAG: 4Fe-4S ferredoxin [Bacteroidetes bacterium GWF2_42_66]|nr:MAG: 4Fe-4S ferredoxin [Bacteroidetes bacterium GWA2_42_15]OFX96214.1 MAG: 4Fe-4S ferredoxin [Bacteroidetes bacterium GWE2_42_39]OFY46253.1 MAG: 4Fe-4S ferredoxin [Bacteroidetes bacterium GWF2_42_66]HBL78374.1 4Fe-4S ferredoxin [Prolixibacteraceae bacterium]HCU60020.1 4Fe-4S ferredoxin [Prolixibacteraceae bacterium]
MLTGNYLNLYQRLSEKIDPKRMFHDPLHTLAFGTDASFYRLIPKLVIKAKNEEEVSLVLRESSKFGLPVTFRAAGTSLSGQAISDSVLLIAGEHWKGYEILDEGQKIRLQPGLIGSKVNTLLAPYRRKIGPDPASINSAMIGGIAANNASGMCCGTADNSYQTVVGMKIIFHDGSVLDTRDAQSKKEFQQNHPEIISEIEKLGQSVKANEELSARIRKKFSIKNTTGYSLNALVDFSDPFDIIEHLMIGSEGTLGFISEITYRTVDELPYKASSMMVFPDIEKACNAVIRLKNEAVSTAELIDRAGLRSVENEPGMPDWIKNLSEGATALLVEVRAADSETLENRISAVKEAIGAIAVEIPVYFTENPSEYTLYWKIRKGLFPSVGAVRKTGTTVIIEDVAFPIPRLAEATLDLQSLFKKYNYTEAVIFGHALDGNLHFVFTQDFSSSEEISRYGQLMGDVANLVVKKYDGSLKAEHGTGRNMAPFVELEWGREAYDLMKQVRKIFDPENLLNPGVILNADEKAHLKNFKFLPPANEKVDKCIECGFCEPSCVSAELTLSPRHRITVLREISRLKASGEEPHIAASLINQYSYSGNETCATDGLCAIACPVKIDTGKMIKELRHDHISPRQAKTALWIACHMGFVTSSARNALSFVGFAHSVLGTGLMKGISGAMRKLSGDRIPQWTAAMPRGSKKIKSKTQHTDNPDKVVYFPSCINRSMGISNDYKEEIQLTEKVQRLIAKAGFEVIFPEGMNDLCCGMAFSSKGYKEAGLKKSKELKDALWKASNNGQYPVLCDMSPCLYTMKENMEPHMKLYEPVEFILEYLVPKLKFTPVEEPISVFPVCSMKKMGLEEKLVQLARMCATNVVVPEANCCGFAGDRGFSFPELNAHGLRYLKEQTPVAVKNGYSTSRTCEIGLTTHSGVSYKSIVYLVDKVSTPKKQRK